MKLIVLLASACASAAALPSADVTGSPPASPPTSPPTRSEVVEKFQFRGGRVEPTRTEANGAVFTTAESPNGGFSFTLSSGEDEETMRRLLATLQIAGGFLENAIAVKRTIHVHVNQGQICPGNTACQSPDPSVLGRTHISD